MRVLLASTILLLAFGASATAARAELLIRWWTIDGGGTTDATGERLRLAGTIGQPDAGTVSGESLVLAGGFWMGGQVVTAAQEEALGASSMAFRVLPGTPNPFRWITSVTVELPEPRAIEAKIHDSTGRVVRHIDAGLAPAGRHSIVWDGRDDEGRRASSGIYLHRLMAGQDIARQTLVLLR
jgi:hypothetical protein